MSRVLEPRDGHVRDVVVIGASAGGITPMRRLVSQLPRDFGAVVLIVQHIGPYPSRLPEILQAAGPNVARFAEDGEPLRRGTIYVAPSDRHLMVLDDEVRLVYGAKEHHTRPAIDPLFRSAALWGGPRVVGIVLSGCNDDGTAGLHAVKACGGVAMVQHPDDAEEPTMPRAALRQVQVDHCLAIDGIASALVSLVGQRVPAALPPPERLVREHQISLSEALSIEKLASIGKPSPLTCPNCNGSLFELEGAPPGRYRCHTGHAFSIGTLREAQTKATEDALWSAIRALQEKQMLLNRMADLDRLAGDEARATDVEVQAREVAEHIRLLRRLTDTA